MRELGHRFNVFCPEQHSRRLSNPLKNPFSLAALGSFGALVGTWWLTGEVLALALGSVSGAALSVLAVRHLFDTAVSSQLQFIRTHNSTAFPIEVMAGSSFGGAVAVEMLFRGVHTGPVLLMCPAGDRLAFWSLRAPRRLRDLPEDLQRRIVVVHGDRDDRIKMADSERLVEGSHARLIKVPGAEHRLAVKREELLGWVEQAMQDR